MTIVTEPEIVHRFLGLRSAIEDYGFEVRVAGGLFEIWDPRQRPQKRMEVVHHLDDLDRFADDRLQDALFQFGDGT